MPRDAVEDVTYRLISRVSVCYTYLSSDSKFQSACEEIAPYVLKAVIHPTLKRLDLIRDTWHPTVLEFYDDVNCDLVYRTLPLLRDLKVLRIRKMSTFGNVPLDVEGFKDTLEEFSSRNFLERDIETLANKCKKIRSLELGGRKPICSTIFHLVSRFECVEDLNLTMLSFINNADLQRILCWLVGRIPSSVPSSQNSGDIATDTGASSQTKATDTETSSQTKAIDTGASSQTKATDTAASSQTKATDTGATSQTNEDSLLDEQLQNPPRRHSGQLKSFGCANVTDEHINLISTFYNLTSLIISDVILPCSLTPLRHLNQLKNLTLIRSRFSDAEELLIAVGHQLICLKFVDVFGTNFAFIGKNCRSLECFHLFFSRPELLVLPANYRDADSHSVPVSDFPLVVSLQLYINECLAQRYIVSRFPNLRNLSVVFTCDDFILLDSLLRGPRPTSLELLYWGTDTLVTFSERRHNIYKFVKVSGHIVQRIVT
jgi:hypothetical protein